MAIDRRGFLGTVAASVLTGPFALAQTNLSEKKVVPLDLPLDNADVWTLHFRYKPLRIVQVNGFDKNGRRAKQTVWYMWYQVYNLPREGRPGEPVTFLPQFELVTKDLNTTHLDEPQPYIFEQIRKIEDTNVSPEKPEGELKFKNSITISKRPIPVSKPDATPRVVSGLAIWTDMAEVAPKTNKFSVYIAGLSNGLAKEELRTGELLIKRKTLQINFVRPTDDNNPLITDIRPDDANGPAEQWVYRTSSVTKSIGAGRVAPKAPPPPPM
ncbi:hypothetical protein R5W23_005143, partial [Gemmata sp. JC673]